MRLRFLLFFCIQCWVTSMSAQSNSSETERLLKEASEEIKNIMNCENLIKSLDEQLATFKSDPSVFAIMKAEVEKQKAEIRKNCVNGVYNPDANSVVVEDEPPVEEESLGESGQKLMDRLSKMSPENQEKAPVTYAEKYYPFSKIPKFLSFYTEANISKATFQSWIQQQYNIELQKVSDNYYQQTLNGIPLWACTYRVVYRTDNSVRQAFGKLHHNAKRANQGAILNYHQTYNILRSNKSAIEKSQDSSLVFVQKNNSSSDSLFYLCYLFADDKYNYFADAVDGKIIAQYQNKIDCFSEYNSIENTSEINEGINNCELIFSMKGNNPEIVNTYYYGPQKIKTSHEGNAIFMLGTPDSLNKIIMYDSLGNKYRSGKNVLDSDNKWLCLQKDKGLLDAFLGANKTMDFYKSKFQRNSFDNNGSTLHIYYQKYELSGESHNNAYWNHDKKFMAYGDYNGRPLSSIDVIAHEFTHGIVFSHCNHMKYFGETGAINEGISDIMAVAVRKYSGLPTATQWRVMEQQAAARSRNLMNPKSSDRPDTYEGSNWLDIPFCQNTQEKKDNCGVHNNSTVISHWFYLLSNAKTGVNDHEKPFECDGAMSFDEATKLVYESIQFLTPDINFKQYADITVLLAETNYGKNSKVACTVKNAWYAVGVFMDAPPKCVPGWTFTLTDQPTGKSVFYGKGDSVIITMFDKETGFRTKMYRYKENAYWKVVSETEEGIQRMTIPNDYVTKLISSENMENMMDAQNMLFEQKIKEEKAKLKNPDLSAEERRQIQETIINAEKIYATSKTEGEKTIQEMKENENEDGHIGLNLITEEEFWEHPDSIKKFDKLFMKAGLQYEGLKAKKYQMEAISWICTTEIPYGLGDIMFLLPGSMGDRKLGVDHFIRGFPLEINGQKIASNIQQYVPGNFDTMFSDAPVF